MHSFMKNIILSLMLVIFASACSRTALPRFSIPPGEVAATSVEVIPAHKNTVVAVHVGLSSAMAADLRQFSKDHLKQQVQIIVGTNVVGKLVFRRPLPSTNFALFYSSRQEAQEVAELLSNK
jgi:hypothetical protein